ncbi:hypothetical protein VMCG_09569 [Cytospora schulzeri]|uniref:Peroxin 20 n=1 Tax=Cytospora schulzeri TaxID=448051 RepID=A0A423VJ78_9PEZI|nr:hypothetical protein VMCG_09569 [Valsa malicola]
MADNLCGPSAPTKGLVGHLNGDRTLQQDRVVNAPAVAGGSTFRSTTEAQANVAAGDAAFAAFTAGSTGPQAHMPRPLQDMQGRRTFPDGRTVHITPDGRTIRDPHPGLVRMAPSAPGFHGGFDGPVQSNTSWVQDFERMQLAQGVRTGPQAAAASGTQANLPPQLYSPHQQSVNGLASAPNYTYMGQGGQMMMATNVGPLGPSRLIPVNIPGSYANQQAGPSTERFDHYPQTVALAANTEEALDAAFAAYDNDFRSEMDQWVAQHGPEPTADQDDILEQLADDLDDRRNARDPSVLAQNDPDNRARLKAQEDQELCKYANEVLHIMEEGNDKFKNSSFTDLMRRIVNREVVVQGNELIDVATGEPTDPTARDNEDQPHIRVPPTPTTIIPPSEEEFIGRQMANVVRKPGEVDTDSKYFCVLPSDFYLRRHPGELSPSTTATKTRTRKLLCVIVILVFAILPFDYWTTPSPYLPACLSLSPPPC